MSLDVNTRLPRIIATLGLVLISNLMCSLPREADACFVLQLAMQWTAAKGLLE